MVAYVIKEGIIQARFVRSSLHSLAGFSSGILYCCSHKLAWHKLAEARERVQQYVFPSAQTNALLQLGSADSSTATVLLIAKLALHRADWAEPWRCLQQLGLFGVPPPFLPVQLQEQHAAAARFSCRQRKLLCVSWWPFGVESAPLELQGMQWKPWIIKKKKKKNPQNKAPNSVWRLVRKVLHKVRHTWSD